MSDAPPAGEMSRNLPLLGARRLVKSCSRCRAAGRQEEEGILNTRCVFPVSPGH